MHYSKEMVDKWANGFNLLLEGNSIHEDNEKLQKLLDLNQAYQQKHGFIFIIKASGKSIDDVIAAIESRIDNDTDLEIKNAAHQQELITLLRVQQYIDSL